MLQTKVRPYELKSIGGFQVNEKRSCDYIYIIDIIEAVEEGIVLV